MENPNTCKHKPRHYYHQTITLVGGAKWIHCTKCGKLLEQIEQASGSPIHLVTEEQQNINY